jgi:CheY-like chemotaxis protein
VLLLALPGLGTRSEAAALLPTLQVIRALLSQTGYQVKQLHCGKELLEYLETCEVGRRRWGGCCGKELLDRWPALPEALQVLPDLVLMDCTDCFD